MSDCATEEIETGLVAADDSQYFVSATTTESAGIGGRPIYYGWIMLPLSMAALIASSPGQTFGVSILNEPMRASLGLTHGQLAAAYMLGTMLGAVPISFIGSLMDRYGLRSTMLWAVSMFAGACLLTATVQGWLMLVLAFFLLRSLGPGALAFLSGNTLPFWFERRLGMVEGLRQQGMAIAMAFIPMFNLWLIDRWGWRGAYAWLGVGIWLMLFPLVWLYFRERPEEVGQAIDGRRLTPSVRREAGIPDNGLWGFTLGETLRTPTFWIVAGGTALYAAIHTAVFFCLVPIFQERDLTGTDAAIMLTVYAASFAVMQLAGGTLADHVRAPFLLCIGLAGLAASILLLFGATTLWKSQLCGIALGASQGIYFGAAQPLWARYFGRRHLGKIRGVLMTIIVATSSLGPLFAGLLRDWRGDFDLALIAFAVAPLPLAILSLFVTQPVVVSSTALIDGTLGIGDGM